MLGIGLSIDCQMNCQVPACKMNGQAPAQYKQVDFVGLGAVWLRYFTWQEFWIELTAVQSTVILHFYRDERS